jgi:hypothetical protein
MEANEAKVGRSNRRGGRIVDGARTISRYAFSAREIFDQKHEQHSS